VTLRMPRNLTNTPPREEALGALATEMKGEQAANLGRLGREVEKTMAALTEAGDAVSAEDRRRLVDAAANAVWRYFIQREATGLRSHAQAIAHYRIPGAVLARVGAQPKKT
jgi:predicted secreted protein